jgi:hypothetical protein
MDCLVSKHLPILHKHLTNENIVPSMYVTEWVVTFFTRSFPFNFVVRVWDIFLHEKHWKIFYRVALALLKYFQHDFLKSNFEEIMMLFRTIPLKISDAVAINQLQQIKKKGGNNSFKGLVKNATKQIDTYRDEKEQIADDIINLGLKIRIKRKDIDDLMDAYIKESKINRKDVGVI